MVEGKRIPGPWREHADVAARDARLIRERGQQVADIPEILTFEDALRLFLERAEQRGFRRSLVQPCRPATVRHYREISATLYRRFGGSVLLPQIDSGTITEYLASRSTEANFRCKCRERKEPCTHKPQTPSGARLNKERQTLRLIFKTAIDANLHPGPNPVDRVDHYGTPDTDSDEEWQFYTPDQVAQILAAIRTSSGRCRTGSAFHDAIAILFLAGLRLGEFVHLRRRHLDLQAGVITVPKEGRRGARKAPMSARLLRICTGLCAEGRSNEYIWRPGEGDREKVAHDLKRNFFPRWKNKIPSDLRARFHAHTFRHSFRSQLQLHAPEVHVDKLGGWSNRGSVSKRYGHATLLQLRQSMLAAFDHLADELLEESPGAAEAT